MSEVIAIALWRDEAACQPSVMERRTPAAWLEESEPTQKRWRRAARAVVDAQTADHDAEVSTLQQEATAQAARIKRLEAENAEMKGRPVTIAEAAKRLLDVLKMEPTGLPEISEKEANTLWDRVCTEMGFVAVGEFLRTLSEHGGGE